MVTVPLQQTPNIQHHSIVPFSHDNKSALRMLAFQRNATQCFFICLNTYE